jgi:hypothetical protein
MLNVRVRRDPIPTERNEMALTGALSLALALTASAAGDRVLLCRPKIAGDLVLARGDAVADAGRRMGSRFLDYGIACEDLAEGARAARRAGLEHAVVATADGRVEASRYVLVLADAGSERERARRSLEVPPGADATGPLRAALAELAATIPREGPRPGRVAAWTLAGAGAAALVAGTVVTFAARDAAERANAADDPGAYLRARKEWREKRTVAGGLLAGGGAALAAGLAWRFFF